MAAAVDEAYQLLREGIFRGRYEVGSRLREEGLASALGVSRSPVREALRRLATEGLVDLTPNRGATVARWDEGELDAILEIRAMLEGYAIRRATPRLTAEDICKLEELCTDAEQLLASADEERIPRAADLHQSFHYLLLSAAGSTRLVNALSGLSHVPLLMRVPESAYDEAMSRSLAHHREIVAAVRAQDEGWAEAIMHAHIRAARGAPHSPHTSMSAHALSRGTASGTFAGSDDDSH